MPHPATARPLGQVIAPVIAGAVLAVCGGLIVGVADPAHGQVPADRCPGCASSDTAPVGVR
ncbi:hypothetical protein ACWD48_06140 [Streptomyces sp. NPDC002519]